MSGDSRPVAPRQDLRIASTVVCFRITNVESGYYPIGILSRSDRPTFKSQLVLRPVVICFEWSLIWHVITLCIANTEEHRQTRLDGPFIDVTQSVRSVQIKPDRHFVRDCFSAFESLGNLAASVVAWRCGLLEIQPHSYVPFRLENLSLKPIPGYWNFRICKRTSVTPGRSSWEVPWSP